MQKIYSCQGNKRWSAHAFAYHPVITPQEALSWLVWAVPLPTGTSSATSHPFPAVLCGTHQLWHFPYLILPRGISSDWCKQCSLISNVHARQRKGSNLGFLHGGCSVPNCEYKDTSKACFGSARNFPHFERSLAILVPWTNIHVFSFTPIFAVQKLFLTYS